VSRVVKCHTHPVHADTVMHAEIAARARMGKYAHMHACKLTFPRTNTVLIMT